MTNQTKKMKILIRKAIQENSLLFRIIKKIYRYRSWYPKTWKDDVLSKYANYKTNVSFVQIGSNNGITGDPIHNYIIEKSWRGILVEPVPYLFNELLNTYHNLNDRLIFENSAIAEDNGQLKFYRLQKSDLPNLPILYDQLGSFNKDVILKHRDYIPSFDKLFIEDKVNTITFNELINKHSINKVDLLHIDTEGYDFEIIKMIPFSDLHIEFIMFEHKHLSDIDYKAAIKLLKQNKFILGIIEGDTLAIKEELVKYL